jgi:DNA-binding winged helix-turn-helix (wHTH) protein
MAPTPVIVFGIHELDEDRWELRRGGLPVPVQPMVLRLLLYLARHRGRVVTRRELLDALWPGTTVTESSVLRAVSLARRALGERAGSGSTIRTYHRRGYRFCAEVRQSFEVQTACGGAR